MRPAIPHDSSKSQPVFCIIYKPIQQLTEVNSVTVQNVPRVKTFLSQCDFREQKIIWLIEFETLEEAIQKVGKWIENNYNKSYVYSKLDYRSPEESEAFYYMEGE